MSQDASSTAPPLIALVVATYRRPDAIAALLRSLSTQTLGREAYEAYIVVDGHDEHEGAYREALEDAGLRFALPLRFHFQSNAGPASARARAIRATRSPWICIADDDMELAPGFLAAHLRALQAGDASTVVIGRVVPEAGWRTQPLYEAMRTHAMLEMHETLMAGSRWSYGPAFVTQNVSLARAAYERLGGFDLSLRLGEDTEFGWRLERAGARFVFAPDAAAVHRSRIGSYETWLARQFQYGRNAVYVHHKLAGDPLAHPLRNLANGSRLNAAAVHWLCWSDKLGLGAIALLRRAGNALQWLGAYESAIATHKAILALAYHLGVKEQLGSWSSLRREERAFARRPDRPVGPT